MSSLFLGTIGRNSRYYEIHCFTSALPFREFPVSRIADASLFGMLMEARFELFEAGLDPAFAAPAPDPIKRRAYNPHDDRPGTVHFVAIDRTKGEIVCGLSIAVDIGDKERGELIGLPLENRWQSGQISEGANLDLFRERYLRLNHKANNSIRPWQMGELYRHFKSVGVPKGELLPRLGVYTGAYHLLVREARKWERQPTPIWVFEAAPSYFHLYRLAGAAVLRNLTIEHPPRYISPSIKDLEKLKLDGRNALTYRGEIVSRTVKVCNSCIGKEGRVFGTEDQPWLDGVINIDTIVRAIMKSPKDLLPVNYEGMYEEDLMMLAASLTITGKRAIDDYHSTNPEVEAWSTAARKLLADEWDFNEIGDKGELHCSAYDY